MRPKMAAIVLAFVLSVALTGCASLSQHPLVKPADALINEEVGPAYEKYVIDDTRLSENDKALRLKTVRLFRELIENIKNSK